MKFTSEDLMKAKKALAEIIRYNSEEEYDNGVEISYVNQLQDECYLISKALEELERLLPRPKRVGDTLCKQHCSGCPLIALQCFGDETKNKPLYEVLDYALPKYHDQEIYDLLKARLDKELKEYEQIDL